MEEGKRRKKESEKGGRRIPVECERLQRALSECHRRFPRGVGREVSCRHLNRGLAECLISVVCPEELEAVRSLCHSSGTALKRSQCHQSRLSLSICLSSHQDP